MKRVVIERLRIIVAPLPVMYNHTNYLASMICGSGVVLHFTYNKKDYKWCTPWRTGEIYTKIWTSKILWVHVTLVNLF